MTGEEIVALSKKHTIFEWSAQGAVDPIPVARAKGVYFWTPEGKRFIDFNSQLMCVNIGHGDPRVIKAIQEQAATLAVRQPVHGDRAAGAAGREAGRRSRRATSTCFFFTNGGAEANENAFKIARAFTGRQKILARYRSYHGGTAGAIAATGDPRRWTPAADARRRPRARPVSRHRARLGRCGRRRCAYLEEVIQLEGPQTIAGVHPRDRSPAPTASWCRPTATCRACARSATSTAS